MNRATAQVVNHSNQTNTLQMIYLDTGYGSTGDKKTSDTLLEVSLPIVNQRECQASFGDFPITNRQLCAGLKSGGKDACQVRNNIHNLLYNNTYDIRIKYHFPKFII